MKKRKNSIIIVQSHGESMAPLIKNGSKVIVDFNHPSSIRLGDVVVFLMRQKLVVHRVLKIRRTLAETEYFLKGDNNPKADGWLKENSILGRVKKVIYPTYQISFTDNRAAILRYVFVFYSHLTGMINIRDSAMKYIFRPLYHLIFFLHSKSSLSSN